MKKVSKLMAMALALFMVLSLAAPAKALDDFMHTPINGTYATFDKYLILDKDADVPDLVFTYTVEGVVKKAASAGNTFEVIGTDASSAHPTLPVMYEVPVTYSAAEILAAVAPTETNKRNNLTFVLGETASNDLTDQWVSLNTTEQKYVKKVMKVDFTGVSFDEPGIYRYKITEGTITGRSDIEYDTQSSNKDRIRYLDVYVTEVEDTAKTLQVSAYILHENDTTVNATSEWGSIDEKATKWEFGNQEFDTEAAAQSAADAAPTPNTTDPNKYDYNGTTYDSQAEAQAAARLDIKRKLDDKSQGFVNELATYDLEFGKKVTGNQGSKDKYFKYTVEITNIPEGTVVQLDVATAADTTPRANSATKAEYTEADMAAANGIDKKPGTGFDGQQLVAESGNKIEQVFYLQHGQYIAIKGLPKDAVYKITEDNEDYKVSKGTDMGTKVVLDTIGDSLDNQHMDGISGSTLDNVVTGTIGGKDEYIVDNANGMFWKDGSIYKPLYQDGGNLYVDEQKTVAYAAGTHSDRYKLNDQNVYTGFTNTKGGVIPTGVFLAAVPGAILAGGALIYLFGKKRHEDEE